MAKAARPALEPPRTREEKKPARSQRSGRQTLPELLLPVAQAMAAEIRAGTYIQADETPLPVQTHDGRGKNHQACLWQYGRPGAGVVFDYQPGRSRAGPLQFLGNFAGILQTDGYAAYEGLGGPDMVHAGCWAHARRKFFEVAKANPLDEEAVALVARCDQLFALDAQARRAPLNHAERAELRRREAPAILAALRLEVGQARARALPSSLLAKAAGYTLAQWAKLNRFLDHPELELSNNLAENSMRPLALGRKNWIHLGSAQAGPRIAAIISVVESCRRLELSPAPIWRRSCPGSISAAAPKSPRSLPPPGPPLPDLGSLDGYGHHVVVLEQVLAALEVLRLDLLLRRRDPPADELALDRHPLLHPQPQHQPADLLAPEDAQQILLERQIEPRRSRIPLPPRASAKLVVNAPRFVPLGPDDVQQPDFSRLRKPSQLARQGESWQEVRGELTSMLLRCNLIPIRMRAIVSALEVIWLEVAHTHALSTP